MKNIDLDIISDIHINTHFNIKEDSDEQLLKLLDSIFFKRTSNKRKYLLIAGDLSESNKLTFKMLNMIQKFYYEKIYFVLGNHDYYVSHEEINNGKYETSFDRINEVKEYYKDNDSIYYLDGDIIDIEGIKLGGCNGWYDGTYDFKYEVKEKGISPIDEDYINDKWVMFMPDFWGMKGIDFYSTIFDIEIKKLNKIYKECDMLMTHVNPSYLEEHQNKKYSNSDIKGFFSFNGHKILESKRLKYYIYGHDHNNFEYEYEGTKVISNFYGYPSENSKEIRKVKTINISI